MRSIGYENRTWPVGQIFHSLQWPIVRKGLAAGGIARRHEPGIGGKLLRVAKARYVVDFCIDQPCKELADARDRLQQVDVGIGLDHRSDRRLRLIDAPIDVADEGEATVYLDAVDLRDVDLSQLDAAGLAFSRHT
ncbi:hypothetical protein AS026_31520 [Rhizobium altiplani]|uniref:Uncharacterized protein n=1 Tax=Rhizobium altiplani TaxID=1864509 RepID=A0A109JYC9_9HYPH|nr:hypothetical protein AS026_31520 [Rhizobium altiplani]